MERWNSVRDPVVTEQNAGGAGDCAAGAAVSLARTVVDAEATMNVFESTIHPFSFWAGSDAEATIEICW